MKPERLSKLPRQTGLLGKEQTPCPGSMVTRQDLTLTLFCLGDDTSMPPCHSLISTVMRKGTGSILFRAISTLTLERRKALEERELEVALENPSGTAQAWQKRK